MPLESWKQLFEIGGVILLFLTFVFGAGALYTATRLNTLQEAQLRQFDKDLTGAKTALAAQQERAAVADGKVAILEKNASDAKAAQQRVEIDLANAQAKLEAERITRLGLQRSVLHRMIGSTAVGTASNFDSLKPFKGTLIVFEHSPEREPAMFSGNLAPFAINSGWAMLDKWWSVPAKRELPDGVTVESYVGPHGETDSSSDAADAFATFLRNNGIDGVRRSAASRGELPPNAVRVLIGQMPDSLAHAK